MLSKRICKTERERTMELDCRELARGKLGWGHTTELATGRRRLERMTELASKLLELERMMELVCKRLCTLVCRQVLELCKLGLERRLEPGLERMRELVWRRQVHLPS